MLEQGTLLLGQSRTFYWQDIWIRLTLRSLEDDRVGVLEVETSRQLRVDYLDLNWLWSAGNHYFRLGLPGPGRTYRVGSSGDFYSSRLPRTWLVWTVANQSVEWQVIAQPDLAQT